MMDSSLNAVNYPALLARDVAAAHEAWCAMPQVHLGSPFGHNIRWAKL